MSEKCEMIGAKCDKTGWVKKKLGEVCEIKNGKNQKKVLNPNGIYPIYGSGGIMGYADEYICEAGTTIIGRKGTINRPLYVNERFWNVDTAFGLQPRENYNCRFLYFLCKSIDFTQYDKSVTIPSLVKSDLLKIEVFVPSEKEQQHIVSELDCLNGIIEKQKEQLKQLDELAQSIFYDMFGDPVENEKGWNSTTLAHISTLKNGINFKRSGSGKLVYFLSVSDFLDKQFIKDLDEFSTVYVNDEIDDSYYLQDEDIIFVRSNGSKKLVGRSIIVYPGKHKITFSGFCIRCRISNNNVRFIGFLLSCKSLRSVIDNLGRGANIANLNQQILGNLPIILPPLPLQQSFASKIEVIEHQKELIKQSLAETENLFNSRMDYYFG